MCTCGRCNQVYPAEQRFAEEQRAIGEQSNEWTNPPVLEELKVRARSNGLWNLFLPVDSAELAGRAGGGLTNLQYAGTVCEPAASTRNRSSLVLLILHIYISIAVAGPNYLAYFHF